ncbi:MAG: hypothetical protein KU38_05290 [Sulfurovum sp. FS08-3]|nr:MAG: hypothetical protein KU38_05290 [Sulfurovum sp. FS08-3]
MNQKIKSFIYLDEYKMYSISSQIFEGLTEHITNSSSKINEEMEKQKAEKGSGRMFADIISKETSTVEKKVLYDNAYKLFEKKLFEENRVLSIDSINFNEEIEKIEEYNFIKVTGKMLFNDIETIKDILEKFNEIGESFAYLNGLERKQALEALIPKLNTQDQQKAKNDLKKISNIKQYAKDKNFYREPKFLESLKCMLDFGYKNQFELRITLPESQKEKVFSANLNRNHLREEESLLIKKYSRFPEKDFVIFGIITQHQKEKKDIEKKEKTYKSMKEALVDAIFEFSKMEELFIGKLDNEIIIDPIAVYQEI